MGSYRRFPYYSRDPVHTASTLAVRLAANSLTIRRQSDDSHWRQQYDEYNEYHVDRKCLVTIKSAVRVSAIRSADDKLMIQFRPSLCLVVLRHPGTVESSRADIGRRRGTTSGGRVSTRGTVETCGARRNWRRASRTRPVLDRLRAGLVSCSDNRQPATVLESMYLIT